MSSTAIVIPPSSTTASPPSTTTLTFIPTETPPPDHSTLRIVATIVPIVVIVAITLWGLLVAGGIMHHRSTYGSNGDVENADFNEKRRAGEEPQLWEVSLKSVKAEDYHDSLHPLALEVQGEETSFFASQGHKSASQSDVSRTKLWRTFTSSSSLTRTDAPMQQAQVTVLVAMPSPPADSPGAKHIDYAIGTRNTLYRGDETKEKQRVELRETPIMMDMCVHGYIG